MMARKIVPSLELPEPTGGDARATAIHLGGEVLVVLSAEIPDRARLKSLSAAEREVADLAIAGNSNESIAKTRGTSVRTVANQLASIFRKLRISSRFELAALWGGAQTTR